MKWFRFYSEVVDDPKVQKLPAKLFRLWVNLLCVAAASNGRIPAIEDLSFRIRVPLPELIDAIRALTDRGLLRPDDDGTYTPHNWRERQYKSDDVTARVRKHREQVKRSGNVSGTASETPSDTDTDTDTDTEAEKEHAAPDGADFTLSPPGPYVTIESTTAETKVVHSRKGLRVVEVSEFDVWFEREFWPAYPKKKAKEAAKKAAKRKMTTRALMDLATAAIKAQAPTVRDPQFFPNGSTWFNGSQWEDEVYAPAAPVRQRTKADIASEKFDERMEELVPQQRRLAQ